MSDSADFDALFRRAKELADIKEIAGVQLYRSGRRWRGECPLCGASKGKRADGAFSVDPKDKVWKCWAECQRGGDVIDLAAKLWRCTPLEVAEKITGQRLERGRPSEPRKASPRAREDLAARKETPQAPVARGVDSTPKAPRWIAQVIQEGVPILGTPAMAYLHGRGIDGELVRGAFTNGRLLYHPRCPYDWDEEARDWRRTHAMIGVVEAVTGATGGIHCTYLARRGPLRKWSKLALDGLPSKKMWGPQTDIAGRPGGVWLLEPGSAGRDLVGEGIESALSAAILEGKPTGVLAALSLNRLQGGWAADQYGRRDPVVVRPDPQTPALTWPGDAAVTIAVDHDMGPLKIKRRKAGPKGGTYDYRMTPTDRAKVCASLAERAWRASGRNRVRAIAPPVGFDFNSELVRRAG